MKYTFTALMEPKGKVRMTRADAWKKRPCVLQYWAWVDEFRRYVPDFTGTPYKFEITFFRSFPKSYSKKKREELFHKPCEEKPDVDNGAKTILDVICKEDKFVYSLFVEKYWDYTPHIEINFYTK